MLELAEIGNYSTCLDWKLKIQKFRNKIKEFVENKIHSE
jgi:hypothetical protein